MYVTEILGRYASGLRHDAPSPDVLHHAKRAVVDWFAAAHAGLRAAPVPMLEKVLAEDLGRGACVLLRGGAATARAAALLHGAAAHAAEVDDSFRDAMIHPGAATVAAALAVAQETGCSGRQFLCGVVAGYEVSTRIGLAMGPSHYRHWHNSGTIGTFGAAASAGVALALDASTLAHALATAATFAAGLQQAFRMDSMSKPLHTGRAAEAGVLAAQLAAAGTTGGLDVLEGESGMGAAMSDEADWSRIGDTLGRDFHIARLTVKNHVGVGHSFAAIDAVLALRARHGLRAHQVRELLVETYGTALRMASCETPSTPNEARFSLRYAVAAALVQGSLRLDAYDPARMQDPALRELMPRIRLCVDPDMDRAYPGKRSARVTVRRMDEALLTHWQEHRRGDPELALSDAELSEKFQDLVAPVLGTQAARALLTKLWGLDRCEDLRDLGRR